MYKFITTVTQLVVSLHFISEDLTYDDAHKESNSFGTQSVCYPRRLYDAHKEGHSIGSPKPNACVIQGDFMMLKRKVIALALRSPMHVLSQRDLQAFRITRSSIKQSSITQSSIKQSRINVLSICTSKQVVEHVSPPKS